MVSVWSDQAKRHAIGCPAATGSSGMSRIFSLVRLLARASAVFAVGRYNLCEWLPFQEDPTVPSPFPGMNPFMEHSDFWTTVHFLMIGAMPHRLAAQVRSGFLVHVDSHVWIHELVDDEEGRGSGKRLLGRGEAFISKVGASTEADFVSSEAATAVLTPARRILIPTVDIERQHYLEIRDKRSREIVTILELLSPANKNSGPDRVQYLNKRAEILASPAHLVEIDLLRCGHPMPDRERPSSTYGVMVSRYEERPAAEFWPIGLRQPLPTIPVPLRPGSSYAVLDLQELLHQVYDGGTYAQEIYEQEADPPLDSADLEWAKRVVVEARR